MKRNFLETLGVELDKEIIDKILDENSRDIGKAKGDFDTVKAENDKLKADLADRDTQLESLKVVDAEGLQAEIVKLQDENKQKDEAHAAEMKQVKIDAAVQQALTQSGALNSKAAKALLDLETAELQDDGTVKGLGDQIKALTEADDSKFLFAAEQKPSMKGAAPGESGNEPGEQGVDTSKMTYEELAAYLAENPDATL